VTDLSSRFASGSIPSDALLTRSELVEALRVAGFPIAKATLESMATRGGGPQFRKFGARPLYVWNEALDWAKGRMSQPVRSTSELDRPATA
jgi:hypothetical protein